MSAVQTLQSGPTANGLHAGARGSFLAQSAVIHGFPLLPSLSSLCPVVLPPSGRRELKGRYMHAPLRSQLAGGSDQVTSTPTIT